MTEFVQVPTLQGLLKVYDPKGGRPVPIGDVYAANTRTREQFEVERHELAEAARRAWARSQEAQRAEMYANSFLERHA